MINNRMRKKRLKVETKQNTDMAYRDMEQAVRMVPSGINIFRYEKGNVKLLISNPAMKRLMGCKNGLQRRICTDEELMDAVHPLDRESVRDAFRALFSEVHASTFTCRMKSFQTGRYLWVCASGISELQEDGSQIGYVSYCDISDRKEAEEELRQGRQRLEAAVEHSGLQYWEYDMIRHRAVLSQKSCGDYLMDRVLEDFPEAWLKTGYIHPDDVEQYRRMIRLVEQGTPHVEWESRCMELKTGAYKWMRLRLTAIFDEEKQPIEAVGTAEDVHAYMVLENRFIRTLEQNGIKAWDFDIQRSEIIRYRYGGTDSSCITEETVIQNVPESILSGGTIHPEDEQAYLGLYRKICSGENQAFDRIRVWMPEKKKYVWQQYIFTAIHDSHGNPVRALCSSRDISEEKLMEQQYLDECRYHEEIASSMLSTSRLNLTKRVLEELIIKGNRVSRQKLSSCSPDYRERSAAFTADSELSDSDNQTLSPDALIGRFMEGEQNTALEYNARTTADGRLMRVHVDCKVLKRPETGELIAFFYESDVIQDYCLKNMMDSIVYCEYDMIGVIFASSGTIFSRSREIGSSRKRLNSYQYEVIVPEFLSRYAAVEDPEALIRAVQISGVRKALENSDTYTLEFDLRESDGTVRKKEVCFSYADRQEDLICVSRRDIEDVVREEKAKQEQLEEALNLAERASSAKSEFLARMSHEMRTPMNAIIGLLSLAKHECEDKPLLLDYLEKMKVSGRHLMNLINDVLDMSRIESGELILHPEECGFSSLLEGIQAVIRPLCEQKQITYLEEGNCSDEIIRVDRLRFQQVFLNLLSNAVKFTHEGGQICFQYHGEKSGSVLNTEFKVCDNGIGMSREFQKHMFEPFTQEEREYISSTQGTGLGLAISKSIVEEAGGTLTVESSPMEGTRFLIRINIPLADGTGVHSREETEKICEPETELSGKRILLAEDHPMNQLIAKRILVNNGVEVITANNGLESLELMQANPPGFFDAILMDIRMPVMDGITAAGRIRSLDREDAGVIPIIAMTANAFEEDRKRTREAGMNAHLAKPIEPSLMLHTLAEWIGRKEHDKHDTGLQ